MVQVTDRVLAKLSIRVVGFFAALANINHDEAAELLTMATNVAIEGNEELAIAYKALIKEVHAELQAEVAGMSESNIGGNPNTAPTAADTPASDYEYRKSDDWD